MPRYNCPSCWPNAEDCERLEKTNAKLVKALTNSNGLLRTLGILSDDIQTAIAENEKALSTGTGEGR